MKAEHVRILAICKEHEDRIYVRAMVNGRLDTVALSELPPEEWAERVARFIEDDMTPAYVRR